MEFLPVLYGAFGGAATLWAMLQFLPTTLLQQLLAKDLEAYKSKLAAESARQLAELQEAAKAREVKLSVAQPQRVESLVALLSALRGMYGAANALMSALTFEVGPENAAVVQAMVEIGAKQTNDAWKQLAKAQESSRLFLTDPLAAKVDGFIKKLMMPLLAGNAAQTNKASNVQFAQLQAKEFHGGKGDELFTTLADIEAEFRTLI